QLVPVHVGLVGHIDHGKTELARALSEKVSTAGLDKHPQAKERGITIDLGFTMFTLGQMRVTLVDAPGHADLIRSVVAGANIIDAAILVVAADEGPKVQTGEHIVVLQSMGIDTVVVAITKTDLVEPARLEAVLEKTRAVMQAAAFKDPTYVAVSAKTGEGVEQLKELLRQKIRPKKRLIDGSFLMPIDHAFLVKGHGTVVTGTIQRGILRIGDTVKLMPQDEEARVRAIQTFGENLPEAKAGDRVGVNIPDRKYSEISRGDYLSAEGVLASRRGVLVRLERNPLYKGRVTNRMVLSTMVGMPNVTAEIVPFARERRTIMDEAMETEFAAALLFQNQIAVEEGQKVILMRTDLPPTHMRIVGSGEVIETPAKILLKRRRVRMGAISRVRSEDVLVEGIASSKERAELFVGSHVQTANGVKGTLMRPFGTRGVLVGVFQAPVQESDRVIYEKLVEEELSFGHRKKAA
ncbi:MAG: selenocysteine-specific translation elongation factor, partial [Candidatus Sifarchaeia archaeon]